MILHPHLDERSTQCTSARNPSLPVIFPFFARSRSASSVRRSSAKKDQLAIRAERTLATRTQPAPAPGAASPPGARLPASVVSRSFPGVLCGGGPSAASPLLDGRRPRILSRSVVSALIVEGCLHALALPPPMPRRGQGADHPARLAGRRPSDSRRPATRRVSRQSRDSHRARGPSQWCRGPRSNCARTFLAGSGDARRGNTLDARQVCEVRLLPIHRLRTVRTLMRLDYTDLGTGAV